MFEDTSMLIQSAVDGYSVCTFAYWQTGSGKTMIMISDKDSPSIVPRVLKKVPVQGVALRAGAVQ